MCTACGKGRAGCAAASREAGRGPDFPFNARRDEAEQGSETHAEGGSWDVELTETSQVGSFTMAQMGQSKSVIGEFMKKKREVRIRLFDD